MPIKKSAMKALRKTRKLTARNTAVKENIAFLRRMVRKAMDSKDAKKTVELAKSVVKSIDKAVQNKVLKRNTGSRIISRLMKKVNALKAK